MTNKKDAAPVDNGHAFNSNKATSQNWSEKKHAIWQQLNQLAHNQAKNPITIGQQINDPGHCQAFSFDITPTAPLPSTSKAASTSTEASPLPLLTADLSKHRADRSIQEALLALADATALPQKIADLLAGKPINFTENRAASHTRLRATLQGNDPEVREIDTKMVELANTINRHNRFKDVIHIGIGGSDLGPRMLTQALEEQLTHTDRRFHFIANIDPLELQRTIQLCDPQTTLLVVCSKSFHTLETLENARTLFDWLGGAKQVREQVIAITNNVKDATQFGIDPGHILPMWDWVGGRYSIWSTIGFTLLLAIGAEQFNAFRLGGLSVDQHFTEQPLANNLPVMMALLGVWYNNFLHASSHCVIPYDYALERLPSYLQQLDMESNGKQMDRWGKPVSYKTGPVIWGNSGTNSQHSFHQLFHQGTQLVPIDFLLPLSGKRSDKTPTTSAYKTAHQLLVANCLAQSEALVYGQTNTEQPYKSVPGNRPHSIITYERGSAETYGALIALYEHKVFCQGAIWEINSFDQWGVELGKQLAKPIYQRLSDTNSHQKTNLSPPTERLILAAKHLHDTMT